MREVIQEIIAAENEARLIAEAARADAGRILADAQEKGHDLLERTRKEILTKAGEIVEAAAEEAEREKQGRLVETASEIENQIRLDQADKEWAVKEVIRCVCKQP